MRGQMRHDWFQTYTGRRIFVDDPKPDDIDIIDIAHALSLICRFNGHVSAFYSVAQHSVLVARLLEPEFRICGVLHDAAEAYLCDIPRPIKESMPEYRRSEYHFMEAVAERYALRWPFHESVYVADAIVLATEARDLIGAGSEGWDLQESPMTSTIIPWTPIAAEREFIRTFDDAIGTSPPQLCR